MPTIQQQLNQLKKDKESLNTMLNTMGVETTGNETFTELTPLVGKIVTDPILQDKSIEITENGTTNIVADSGYNGLNNVEVITNVAGGGETPSVTPDYITNGLIAWFDGEDEMDANKHWNSRVGSDYISVTGTGIVLNGNPYDLKGKKGYKNCMTYSLGTSADYFKQGYTIEVVGKINSGASSSEGQGAFNTTVGGILWGIGRSTSIYCALSGPNGQLRMANNSAVSYPRGDIIGYGKTFSCATYFEQIANRGAGGTEKIQYTSNGKDFVPLTQSLGTPGKAGNNITLLCYYPDSYRSNGEVNCVRVYNRKLTWEEVKHNYEIDKVRFGITN